MSTHYEFQQLARRLLKNSATASSSNPSIYPIPKISIGNHITEHKNKIRRTWSPNVHTVKWPVSLLGGQQHRGSEKMAQIKMKMVVRDNKKIEYSGGLEAALMTSSRLKLSNEGRVLRTALFKELHRIREDLEATHLTEREKVKRRNTKLLEDREASRGWHRIVRPKTSRIDGESVESVDGGSEGDLLALEGKKEGADDVVGLIG